MRNRTVPRRLTILFLVLALVSGFFLIRNTSAQQQLAPPSSNVSAETETTDASTTAGTSAAPDVVWQGAHTSVARAVAFSPDGQQLASGGDDRTAKLWQASDGTLLRNLLQCGGLNCGSVGYLAFSPDGQTLASTGRGLKFWRVSDGTLLRTLSVSAGNLALSPDWQYLATSLDNSSYPGTVPSVVTLIRVSDGIQLWQASGGGGREVTFSPDGQTVAAVGKRTGIDLWRTSDGAHLLNIPGPKHDLLFTKDGQYLISTQGAVGLFPYDETIDIYRVSDGSLVQTLRGSGVVSGLALTPDGQVLISTGWDPGSPSQTGVIRFWRLSDGALIKTYDQNLGQYTAGIAVSPDGKYFSYTYENSVAVARMPSFSCVFSIDQPGAVYQHPGGAGLVRVTAPEGCSWIAYSRASWVHITSGASGTGNGIVTYTVDEGGCYVESPTGLRRDAILVIAEQTYDVNQNECPLGPGHYSINGLVTDGDVCYLGIEGVTVTLSGAAVATTTTDADGWFHFNNLTGQQSYTVTLSKDGYTFSPQTMTVDKLSYDYSTSYKATTNPHPPLSVNGYVKDTSGQPLPNAGLYIEGGIIPRHVYTDSSGLYHANCLPEGRSYTLTPSLDGYDFSPRSRSFDPLSSNQTGDFVGYKSNGSPVSISGHVMDDLGGRLPDVNVLVQNQQLNLQVSARTDEKGFYQISDLPAGYDYTVQPALEGYGFAPASQSVSKLSSDGNLDFTATPLDCTYALSATGQHFSAGAGSGFFNLTAKQGCAWKVRISDAWIDSYTSDGNGSATLSFYVEVNQSHEPRSGQISVGGQTFNITQDAAPDSCQYTVTPSQTIFGPEGGEGVVQVSVGSGCEWRARSNDFWITVTSGSGDRGDGLVRFIVGGNGGTTKTGSLSIAGQTIIIEQEGRAVSGPAGVEEVNPFNDAKFWLASDAWVLSINR